MTLLAAMMGEATAASSPYPYAFPASAPFNVPYPTVTPTDDGTGSSMHPSGLDFGEKGWGGHRYWLATTAFFNAEEPRENPHIYHSDDGFVWEWPEGVTNPLDPWPGAGTRERWYNSDTNLVHDPATDTMILTWREVRHTRASQTIWARTSKDGTTWTPAQIIHEVPDDTNYWSTSQSLVKHSETEWRLYYMAGNASGPWNRYFTAPSWEGPFTSPRQITFTGPVTSAYHGEIRRLAGGRYVGIIQQGGKEYPCWSSDGVSFTVGSAILQAVELVRASQAMYKASICADAEDPSMMHVWYTGNGTWNNHVYYTRVPITAWGA